MVLVKNTRTGKVKSVPDHYLNHPSLGADLVIINEEKASAAPKKATKKKAAKPVEVEETNFWGLSSAEETEEQAAPDYQPKNDEEIN